MVSSRLSRVMFVDQQVPVHVDIRDAHSTSLPLTGGTYVNTANSASSAEGGGGVRVNGLLH